MEKQMYKITKEAPKYKSHKKVRALRIVAIQPDGEGALLHFFDHRPVEVDSNYLKKHNPNKDGYYVVYEDGYESFSPKEVFKEGYTRIDENVLSNESFTEADLVSFGKYLLSKERYELIHSNHTENTKEGELYPEDIHRDVHHADLENWKDKKSRL